MTIATATLGEGAMCKPNISPAGRRLRRRFGLLWVVLGITVLGAMVVLGVPSYWRALLGLPACLAAVGFLQARRGTCVSRAAEGTFEHQDFSKTKVSDTESSKSRRAAAVIVRDAVLIGVLCGVIATATALIR